MKRVLSLVLVAGVAFLLGHFLRGPMPHAGAMGGGAATPSGNGDVNGDGALNLTDAVYLLQHLFQGGPAPVPLVPEAAGLPATGLTKCYDDFGDEIPCDTPGFPGQDGFYQAGCPVQGRFVDHGDGTVTDTSTGLMWQKDTADVSRDGTIGDEDAISWQAALTYCDSLTFAGHDDWRLPNVRELQSIVDYGRFNFAIDPTFRAMSVYYWSSSTIANFRDYAWTIEFDLGSVSDSSTKITITGWAVRAVRNAK